MSIPNTQRQYAQEQLEQIYEKLPEELKEAIFAKETADNIWDICKTYGITDERSSKIAEYAGHVLMGILAPNELLNIFENELKVPKALANAIVKDLNRLIFYPVKPALEQLHNMEIGKTQEQKPEQKIEEQKSETKPVGQDAYREPLE